jgi:hypothetical protein
VRDGVQPLSAEEIVLDPALFDQDPTNNPK